jgi:hypothetical protein
VQQYHTTWGKFDPLPYPYSLRSSGYDRDLWLRYPKFPYFVLDTEPEYMSIENQREEAANRLKELRLFEFFLRPSLREGEVSSDVYKVNLVGIVQDNATGELSFPDQVILPQIRSLLEATAGIPIKTLLAEQDALLPTEEQKLPQPKTPGPVLVSPQPSADDVSAIHPPLPPRRHRIR